MTDGITEAFEEAYKPLKKRYRITVFIDQNDPRYSRLVEFLENNRMVYMVEMEWV